MMMRVTWWVLAIAVLAYAGICAALFALQRSMVYFPQPAASQPPGSTMQLAVDGADLRISVRPLPGARALIYFGGNAEDVSASLESFSKAFPDRAIYLMHYRGYGGSTGQPAEKLLHRDALALFDKVQAEHTDVAVMGRSLGSGVAVRLASQRPVSRLVLVTPYDSILNIAAGQFPWVPVRWLLTDTFESWRHAPAIHAPTLLLAAENDDLIPRASTERLLAAFAQGVAAMVVLPGTGHNTISVPPAYLEAIRRAFAGLR